jgi:hypothetical protein
MKQRGYLSNDVAKGFILDQKTKNETRQVFR